MERKSKLETIEVYDLLLGNKQLEYDLHIDISAQ